MELVDKSGCFKELSRVDVSISQYLVCDNEHVTSIYSINVCESIRRVSLIVHYLPCKVDIRMILMTKNSEFSGLQPRLGGRKITNVE
jgi:hypothetical protein